MSENSKINMSKVQTKMPKVEIDKQLSSFDEVELGYNKKLALQEAARCLGCKHKPCAKMCPAKIEIPNFIKCILKNDLDLACSILYKSSPFPAICGRVCPQEKQCQAGCVRGKSGEPVAIGNLERYASENGKINFSLLTKSKNNIKIAVIGAGPSGLACARDLALMGYSVTVFESLELPGGVLRYGIPKFRLPKNVLDKEIKYILDIGVEIIKNTTIGKKITLDTLFSEMKYKAVYLSTGSWVAKKLSIPGENFKGVYSAVEFLYKVNLGKENELFDIKPKNIVVIGGGSTAIDAARVAKRLGSKVTLVYRRTKENMSCGKEEIIQATEEGIEFEFSYKPIKIFGQNGTVNSIEFEKNLENEEIEKIDYNKKDTFEIECECIVVAIGNKPNKIDLGVAHNSDGKIITDPETTQTSKQGVFAGGDVAGGPSKVVFAIKSGKKAAANINIYLTGSGDG